MKALLLCPGPSPAVAGLLAEAPLATVPLLGETLLAYWLVYLASLGAKEVIVVASDRPEHVRRSAGDGARWGIRVRVVAERSVLTPAEARERHGGAGDWLPSPHDAVLTDHLPGLPEHRLGESYAAWFAAVQAWLDCAVTPDRVGVREVAPGIRVGWQSVVASGACLVAPCWIGEKVRIGADATIGPNAVVEDRAVVESRAIVTNSVVGPETFVGTMTEITDSFACGDLLINWRDDSCLRVPDEFLLSSLRRSPVDSNAWLRRVSRSLKGAVPSLPLNQTRLSSLDLP